ncbi:DUF6127 family protein [uncultured Tateyamaria sp.]|uniref:DUF6127 family protein n=1 Tax=uncultured Tateyamaria sp. TaxID=455651 RepID=UPI002623C9BC|nr:DUF6127 family protein [uncultured Tateyamaria sp.]
MAGVGLDRDEAALDIRDLRSLLDCVWLERRTAMQIAVRMITTGVMLALLAGIAIKLKIFGGGPLPIATPNCQSNRPAFEAGHFVSGGPHDHNFFRSLARRA